MKQFPVQQIKSEYLSTVYSINPKINSVIRTLYALHGKDDLWRAVSDYVYSDEAKNWDSETIWQLYQSARWAIVWG